MSQTDETPRPTGKDLMAYLTENELTAYGSVILADDVRAVLGLVIPKLGTRKQFTELALRELAAVDYCRNALLGEGKYLAQQDGDYRILLPSENARQVDLYVAQADHKLKRALKLNRGTQQASNQGPDSTAVRVMMKRESLKSRVDFQSAAA